MKNKICLIVAMGIVMKSFAYEYPSINSVEDIQTRYPKSCEQIEQRKERASLSFHKRLKDFLGKMETSCTTSQLLQQWDEMIANLCAEINTLDSMSMVEPQDKLREKFSLEAQNLRKDLIEVLAEQTGIYMQFAKRAEQEKKRPTLNAQEAYYLQELLKNFKQEGLHLPEQQRKELKQLKLDLAKLSETFARNIQEDKSSILVHEKKLTGLDEEFIQSLPHDDQGLYQLGCDYPTYFMIMKACSDAETRKALYMTFMNRAYPQNEKVLNEMIAKRDQLAKVLGFESFAHLQLANEMVKDPKEAKVFLDQLSLNAQGKLKQEAELFKKEFPAIALTQEGKFYPWDVLYLEEQYKQQHFHVDDELIKTYFPLESTLDGLIHIFESFFDLKMLTMPIQGLWHEDVKLLKIMDKTQKKLYGYIVMDLFPRANKYSHACHSTLVTGLDLPDGTKTASLSLLIANFPKSTPSKPSLMTLSDVRTFFHEFGHGIHAVMGRTQFSDTAGTSVKTDFVELPSQMLEEWLWDPAILTLISSHYKTHEKIPQELIQKIVNTRQVSSGCFVGRQCLFSNFSLGCFLAGENKDLNHLMQQTHQHMNLYYAYDDQAHFQASFGHLDGYGARYYGYLWSRVFALDLFEQIKQEGLLNPQAGLRYLKEILSKGGSEDPAMMLRNYLGREPSQEPFLKAYGIK